MYSLLSYGCVKDWDQGNLHKSAFGAYGSRGLESMLVGQKKQVEESRTVSKDVDLELQAAHKTQETWRE